MKRIVTVLAATALMVVLMGATVSPALAEHKGQPHYGWGPEGGHQEGVKFNGHEAGEPNGWWYVYDCGYTGKGPEKKCAEEDEEHGHRYS